MDNGTDRRVIARRRRTFRAVCGFDLPRRRFRDRMPMGGTFRAARIANQIEKARRHKAERRAPVDD